MHWYCSEYGGGGFAFRTTLDRASPYYPAITVLSYCRVVTHKQHGAVFEPFFFDNQITLYRENLFFIETRQCVISL